MTIDVAELRQLHRSYQPVPPYGELYCQGCYLEWPCSTSELLDAYEERDRLRADVQAAINEWGHASHCELYVSQNDIPSACDCIIGDLKRALEGRE